MKSTTLEWTTSLEILVMVTGLAKFPGTDGLMIILSQVPKMILFRKLLSSLRSWSLTRHENGNDRVAERRH